MAVRPDGAATAGDGGDADAQAPVVQVQFFAAPEAVEEAAKRKAANRAKRRAHAAAEADSLKARGRLSQLEARLAALEREAAHPSPTHARPSPKRASPRPPPVDVEASRESDLSAATTDGGADRRAGADDDGAADGFLLAFLVAGGVDAPRAVRAAARLRLHGACGDTRAFANIDDKTLRGAGLRPHEIRALLRAAKLARSALRGSPTRKLPRVGAKHLRSKSAQEADPTLAYGRGVKPRIDATAWAKKRRELVLSAERRRKLRQTE
jgi:hypothetical protein